MGQSRVQTEVLEGLDAGVQGTPTVFLNGRLYRGNVKVAELKPAVEAALKAALPQGTKAGIDGLDRGPEVKK